MSDIPDEGAEDKLLRLFIDEATTRCESIERDLLRLHNSLDASTLGQILSGLLRVVHSLKGASGFVEMRSIESACHWMEDTLTSLGKASGTLPEDKIERLLAVNGTIAYLCQRRRNGPVDDSRLIALLNEKEPVRKSDRSPTTQISLAGIDSVANLHSVDEMVRISSTRIDALLYRSTELVHSRFRSRGIKEDVFKVQELVASCQGTVTDRPIIKEISTRLKQLSERLDNGLRYLHTASAQLENEIRRARMLPFKAACDGLWRIVQSANADLGKEVSLEIRGSQIEIDRGLVPNINDILRHMVRNAVYHGIGTPAERAKLGKNPTGRIEIVAETNGDRLRVMVRDDGGGILNAVLKNSNRQLKDIDEEVLKKDIFSPGYTTALSVTKLSGRGVGLDIVKKTVEELRGFVEVDSNPADGTTFTIDLPLSMASTRTIFVKARGAKFALETAAARRFSRYEPSDLVRDKKGRLRLQYEGKSIPALNLTTWIYQGHGHTIPESHHAVIIGSGDGETAVLVDEVAGEQGILVRPMGRRLSNLRRYSGAVTMDDGTLVLLLNHSALEESALGIEEEEVKPTKRILLVDDSPTIRMFAERYLRAFGYEVVAQNDGKDALGWLMSGHEVDAVIADVEMPNMDGLTLTRAIKKLKNRQTVPVVLVTSRGSDEDRAKGMEAGADAYFVKSKTAPETVKGVLQALFS